MKTIITIEQDKPDYQPIRIVIETRAAAVALFSLMARVENYRTNVGQEFKPTMEECAVVVRLCNAFHGQEVVI